MAPLVNPLNRFLDRLFRAGNSEKLYGAIVAQARLQAFYRDLRIPDNLEGRFGLLVLNLFPVLYALAEKGSEGARLAQSLTDRFSKDMETVLREMGVGDLAVPKKMRNLVGSTSGLFSYYEEALQHGDAALAAAIEETLPVDSGSKALTSKLLASYVKESAHRIARQPLSELQAGHVDFAGIPESE